jgi:Lrp/AsnC family leucine-responsive transcriptional regulator
MSEHLPDRVDRAIVTRLQQDGRIANVDLADAVSLSPSACLRRVKALEASGIIAGYHAEVSRARAGLGLTVFIGLTVQSHSRQASQQILAVPAVDTARSVFAIRTVLSRGPLPLDHWR